MKMEGAESYVLNYKQNTICNFLKDLFNSIENENLYLCIRNAITNENGKKEFQEEFFPCTSSGINESVSHILSLDKDRDIYFRCQVLSKKDLKKESAEVLTFLYADIDFKENKPESAKNYPTVEGILTAFDRDVIPRPSIVINTGNGYHCYWILKKPVNAKDNPEIVSKWQHKIKSLLNRYIDSTGDLSRILRIPGTFNNKIKENPLHVSTTAIGNNKFYDLDEVMKQYEEKIPSTYTKTRGKVISPENPVSTTEKKGRNNKNEFIQKDYNYSKEEKERLNEKRKDQKFKSLEKGEWKSFGYKTQSHADFGFLVALALIFDKNPEKMKAFFMKSGLNNEERVKKKGSIIRYFQYVDRTINKVLRTDLSTFSKPKRGKKTGKYEFDRLHNDTMIKLKLYDTIRVYHSLIRLERKYGIEDGGRLFVSYDQISKEAGVSKSSVKRHLETLERLGLIHSLILGKSNSREKRATEFNRTIPIPHKLQGLETK